MTRVRKVLTFSNVIACLALFMALGGTVYAAGKINGTQIKSGSLPGNRIKAKTVTANQVKPGSLTGKQIKTGSLTGTQIATGSLTGTQIATGSITGTQINQTTLTGVSAASIGSVTYVTATVTAPSGGSPSGGSSGTANCPSGTFVIGGGATLSTEENPYVNDSGPNSSHTGWTATFFGEEGTKMTITAICTPVKTVTG